MKTEDNNEFDFRIITWSIGIIVAIFLLIFVFDDFSHNSREVIPNINYFNNAKNCENETVKDLVIQIFKENDYYYKYIDENSISNISIQYPSTISYDKDINKYSCTAQIIMYSNSQGFLPNEYDTKNHYYFHIYDWSNYKTLAKYTKYIVPVDYTSEISEGNTLVYASDEQGKFTCDGDCSRIVNWDYVEEKVAEEGKRQQKDKDEHVTLPF